MSTFDPRPPPPQYPPSLPHPPLQGAHTCYFTRVSGSSDAPAGAGGAALSTLYDLEATIQGRQEELKVGGWGVWGG